MKSFVGNVFNDLKIIKKNNDIYVIAKQRNNNNDTDNIYIKNINSSEDQKIIYSDKFLDFEVTDKAIIIHNYTDPNNHIKLININGDEIENAIHTEKFSSIGNMFN